MKTKSIKFTDMKRPFNASQTSMIKMRELHPIPFKTFNFNWVKWKNIILNSHVLLVFFLFSFWSCIDSNELEKRNWQIVWQDEFDSDGAPDATKWTYEIGGGGWGNAELQTYTNQAENVVVEDGVLKITALANGNTFTSARIITKGLFEQAYGRFEASIKMPWGPGIWPAFWLLGADIDQNPWPQCGEIDIVEYRGQEPNLIHGSVHGPGYSGVSPITKSFGFQNNRFDTDFHVFAIEWGEGYIHFYVDETIYQEITPDDVKGKGEWVYDHPFYILLNLAVGGNYVGFPTSKTTFPQTMEVDWVRVYQEAN
jgi:beta-glucanase (GH16 family)